MNRNLQEIPAEILVWNKTDFHTESFPLTLLFSTFTRSQHLRLITPINESCVSPSWGGACIQREDFRACDPSDLWNRMMPPLLEGQTNVNCDSNHLRPFSSSQITWLNWILCELITLSVSESSVFQFKTSDKIYRNSRSKHLNWSRKTDKLSFQFFSQVSDTSPRLSINRLSGYLNSLTYSTGSSPLIIKLLTSPFYSLM